MALAVKATGVYMATAVNCVPIARGMKPSIIGWREEGLASKPVRRAGRACPNDVISAKCRHGVSGEAARGGKRSWP